MYKLGQEKTVIIDVDKNNEIISYSNEDVNEVGDYFLRLNEKLSEVNMPKLEKTIDKRFDYIVEENRANKQNKITSSDIATLDKENNLTTTDIDQARQSIEKVQEQENEIEEK